MSVWNALNAGAQSFQQGVNWTGRTVDQINQLRTADEQTRLNRADAEARRQQQQQLDQQAPSATGQGGATPGVTQAPPQQTALPPQGEAPQGGYYGGDAQAQAQGQPAPAEAPAAQEDEPWRGTLQQAMDAHKARWNGGQSATGQPAEDEKYVRDTITGRGTLSPNQTVALMRGVSGNRDRPLNQSDAASVVDSVVANLNRQGLGHLADAWRARFMQNIQSAAARTAAVGAAQAESGDLMGSARTMSRAFAMIPDGTDVQVTQGQDGTPVGQRIGRDGQPMGSPIPLTAQRLREMAIATADPGAFETLLLQREDRAFHRATLAETQRHNQATEANARARGAGGGARAGGEVSLTPEQRRTAYADIDTGLEGYAAERGTSRTGSLDEGQVRTIAQGLVERQIPGSEAVRLARAIGTRQVQPALVDGQLAVNYNGRYVGLPGPLGSLVQQYTTGGGQPTAPPTGAAGPTHSGRRPVREPTR